MSGIANNPDTEKRSPSATLPNLFVHSVSAIQNEIESTERNDNVQPSTTVLSDLHDGYREDDCCGWPSSLQLTMCPRCQTAHCHLVHRDRPLSAASCSVRYGTFGQASRNRRAVLSNTRTACGIPLSGWLGGTGFRAMSQ